MPPVRASSFPAPRPMSPMAGATSARISTGTMKPRKFENSPLKVAKACTSQVGATRPTRTPATIATRMRGSRPKRRRGAATAPPESGPDASRASEWERDMADTLAQAVLPVARSAGHPWRCR